MDNHGATNEATSTVLREIVRRFGTPTYAFSVQRLQAQVEKLRTHFPPDVELLYSLKANASLGICDVFAASGIGADVSSAGELATAIEAGFPAEKIFVAGPFKVPETIAQLRQNPSAVVSVDSPSELQSLSDAKLANRVVIRLRPDFGSCAVVQAGSESRFGFTCDQLAQTRELLASCHIDVIGFHVFAGSQVLDPDKLTDHLTDSLDLSLRAADTLGISATLINLGGGFGIPYGPADNHLDLIRIGDEMAAIAKRAAPTRLVMELGRYLVAESGWYMTSVLGHQTFQGRDAVVVDGGVHQRADMCGLRLRTHANPPLVLRESEGSIAEDSSLSPTDVLGCLSLPDDVLIERSMLPTLAKGDVLAFGNAGAYGLWSSPAIFHSSPLPAEVAFNGSQIQVMRERKPAQSILEDQQHVIQKKEPSHV
ncbi:MAG: alanine racemase [Pirellulaceae bacterium]